MFNYRTIDHKSREDVYIQLYEGLYLKISKFLKAVGFLKATVEEFSILLSSQLEESRNKYVPVRKLPKRK